MAAIATVRVAKPPATAMMQSLGCVEMPLEEAGEIWPYTPIGTPVTVNPA